MIENPGKAFRQAVERNNPLQVVGAVNAYSALLAEQAGHQAIYLSGGGVAACSNGIPDLGITTLEDVATDAARICNISKLPLLVDIDTGWGGMFNIQRSIRRLEKIGVAAVHIEDQVEQKRCGHRPNKAIVSQSEMVDRVKAAVDAKDNPDFVVMARTDALAVEGFESAIERATACVEAGADMIFPEAMQTLEQYQQFVDAVNVPVLANITEFGATPLFTQEELASVGVKLQLYPLSAFRAMSLAALKTYESIATQGHQKDMVEAMQTRNELYEVLDYHRYEQQIDAFLNEEKN